MKSGRVVTLGRGKCLGKSIPRAKSDVLDTTRTNGHALNCSASLPCATGSFYGLKKDTVLMSDFGVCVLRWPVYVGCTAHHCSLHSIAGPPATIAPPINNTIAHDDGCSSQLPSCHPSILLHVRAFIRKERSQPCPLRSPQNTILSIV